jgi:Na+-transporting NADH:ubiquinone oxidoreductase subunit NqrE
MTDGPAAPAGAYVAAPPVSSPSPASRPAATTVARPAAAATRSPRRARLAVRKVDPRSVFRFSLVYSIAIAIIWVVAIGLLYAVLDRMGAFDSINKVLADFTTKNGAASWQLDLSMGRVIVWSALIGLVNAVLFTALATLAAFMYNVCTSVSGGLEVTLTERD